jgi:putative ABC transport system substrate-binding protein
MKRRNLLGFAAAALAAPTSLFAQQPARVYRVAMLWGGTESSATPYRQAVLAGLQEFGYVAGRNLDLHDRYGNGDASRFPALVDELIALQPDVMAASSQPGALAMKAKTATLPIVFLFAADPVAAGLVQNLARPGTNATGLSNAASLEFPKRVELLVEAAPRISRLVFLLDDTDPGQRRTLEPIIRAAAEAKGLKFGAVGLRSREDLGRAFAEIEKQRPGGLLVSGNPLMILLQREIVAEVRRVRLPAISNQAGIADAGLLMTFGVNVIEGFRYSTKYIDRILKGAKPADLPVEQFPKYELVVNLRTARELDLKIPQSILVRADRVIE